MSSEVNSLHAFPSLIMNQELDTETTENSVIQFTKLRSNAFHNVLKYSSDFPTPHPPHINTFLSCRHVQELNCNLFSPRELSSGALTSNLFRYCLLWLFRDGREGASVALVCLCVEVSGFLMETILVPYKCTYRR